MTTTITDAIARSISNTEIVTIPFDADGLDELATVCHGSAEGDDRTEFWGKDWRVHMLDQSGTYRAAYWQSEDYQTEIVLTDESHAHLDDAALRAEGEAEFARWGMDMAGGAILVGEWTE